ncbi:MAG: DsbE family thiol:disulfide interchange protein [Pseudomonadota bacterium]
MHRASLFVPLGLFVVIVAVGYVGFSLGDRHVLPSALLKKPFPQFRATTLHDPDMVVERAALLGAPVLVNVWATWCPTCQAEHEELTRITQVSDIRLVGINYKDDRAKALNWLAQFGNPYDLVVYDDDGLLGVELGVYGAPETFLLDADGTVIYKRVGDVNRNIWQTELLPRLRELGVRIQAGEG